MAGESYTQGRSGAEGFFGVLADPQSYLNIVYLFFSFPLGVFYFVFLITGFAVGLSLAILIIGLVILFLVLWASRGLAAWERQLSIWLLEAHFPPQPRLITVFFVALTLSLILTPLVYNVVPVQIGLWRITSLDAALLCLACGLLLGILSIYVMNGLAFVWRALAMALLSAPRATVATPVRRGPIIIH
jgi:hypothetical protein